MKTNAQYIQVFSDGRLTLLYPARLWSTMSERERVGVVRRQSQLAARMRRANAKTAVSRLNNA